MPDIFEQLLSKIERTLSGWETVKRNKNLTAELIAEGDDIIAQARDQQRNR